MKETPKALMTYIIVKSESKHYHIYNASGDCVGIVNSRLDVTNFIHDIFCPSSFTSYTFKYTAAPGTFIVIMKQYDKRKIMKETWTTCANALGQVLKEWRTSNGISLYAIAKYGNTRVENIKKVEEGVANMLTLARYLVYIYSFDAEFFDRVLNIWQDKMKG